MQSSGRRASFAAALFLAPAAAAAQTAVAGPATSSAPATTPAADAPVPIETIIQGLLDQHRFDEADRVLDQVDAQAPGDPETKFLRGMVALGRGDHKRAIKIFRDALIDHPEAVRIRLELARAFYLDGDYANATRQFRFALAGNPPKGVAAAINHYLDLIRQSKSWSYSFDVSLAPDTNLNAGPGTRDITIYGLPFELSDDARGQSGIGLSLDGSAEYAPSIGKDTRLRMGIQAGQLLYTKPEYDDTNATVYVGPRFVRGRWDFSVLATGFVRRYGGDPYNGAVGGRLEATYYPSGKTAISASFAAQRARYAFDTGQNGGAYTFSTSVIHTLDAVSGFVVKGGVSRQSAIDPARANTAYYAAVGYFRDLPGGFTIYVEPSLALARYDGLFEAFGVTRSDTGYTDTLTLLNRHIVLSRFTPKISYSYTHQNSNIALYQYRRSRVEIGLTTTF
jgi:outer membrane protein